MVIGEHNMATQMASPTMVSDQKTHISPSRHSIRSKPSSSKFGKNRRKSNAHSFSSVKLHAYAMNDQSSNTNSPYYKGLTDQSLAIISSCPAPSHTPTTDLLISSPYYKGLTDYSLVLGPWNPSHQNHPIPPNNSLPSPYYRGLIDYSLALHRPPITDTDSCILSINKDDIMHPGPISSYPSKIKTDFTLRELMIHADHLGFLIPQTEREIEMEGTSEETQVGSALEETADKTALEEMGLTTKEDDDVCLAVEENLLKEKGSEAVKVESASEDNDAETIMLEEMELIGHDDDVEMVIEEKALRERVSETRNDENLREKTIMEEVEVWKKEELKEKALELQCKEYTWAAKHQPKTLADFICNCDKALQLKTMVKQGCACKHFIFEGPPSAGKRSMIRAMLREVFGADKVQVTEECKEFNLKGEMVDNLQVRVKKSVHHVELNLSETKGYEKHVIVDLFMETYGKILNNSLPCSSENCQAIILYEAEKLSIESLLYIKWLLEKYSGCNKVFFCCSDESKLQPVKPLCTTVRLSSPSTQEMLKILEYIGREEGKILSSNLVEKIIMRSKNNLRQAIRSLEATCRNKDVLRDDDLILTGWEDDILDIAKKITEEQSPRQLYLIRGKLQSLMMHDVPPDFIYKSLVTELTRLVDESLRSGVAKLDKEFNRGGEIKFETTKQLGTPQNKQAESDEKNNESTKKIIVLTYLKVEEFVAKFMSWYKNSSEKGNKYVQLSAET